MKKQKKQKALSFKGTDPVEANNNHHHRFEIIRGKESEGSPMWACFGCGKVVKSM